jgi:glycerophosphoryl diester phosphodiesterase
MTLDVLRARLDRAVLRTADALFARLPHAQPTPQQICAARIVAHRGERDDTRVFENTYAAYDPLIGSGVWGLECDVRWTADRIPVVFHDNDLRRLFNDRRRIRDLDCARLQRDYPMIPRLDEFVRRYVQNFHLMIELKAEPVPEPDAQQQALLTALEPAMSRQGCHVLSLRPEMFRVFSAVPATMTVGVARTNVREISADVLTAGRAGIGLHYMFTRGSRVKLHHQAGQKVGIGFPDSAPLLRRALAAGADWIFTNRPREMQRHLTAAAAESG